MGRRVLILAPSGALDVPTIISQGAAVELFEAARRLGWHPYMAGTAQTLGSSAIDWLYWGHTAFSAGWPTDMVHSLLGAAPSPALGIPPDLLVYMGHGTDSTAQGAHGLFPAGALGPLISEANADRVVSPHRPMVIYMLACRTGRELADHLVEAGNGNVAVIASEEDVYPGWGRLWEAAFRAGVNSIPLAVMKGKTAGEALAAGKQAWETLAELARHQGDPQHCRIFAHNGAALRLYGDPETKTAAGSG